MNIKSNGLVRIFGSIIFVVVVFGLIGLRSISTLPFDIAVVVVGTIGSFELLKIKKDTSFASRFFLIATAVFALPFIYLRGAYGLIAIFLLTFCLRAIASICEMSEEKTITDLISNYLFASVYPQLCFLLLVLMGLWDDMGTILILLVFMVGPFCDVGAYLFGVTIGGKKLCPSLSPKKTIAGAVGGVFGGLLGSMAVFYIATTFFEGLFSVSAFTIAMFVLIGIFGAVVTEIGDLVESGIKRNAGVKDSGKFLPGHGGMLDRFDGVIMIILLVYAWSIFLFM